jgi:cytochrome c oxidase subunit 2
VRLVVVGLAMSAAALIVALFVPWLPTPASRQAGPVDFVFWFVSGISIAIFGLVAAVILIAVWRFRARPDDDSDGPPIHGHTGLEIVWTAIPAVLVTAIAVVSTVALAKNDRLPRRHLTVDVRGQQFAWSFSYPKYGHLSSAVLRLPLKEAAELRITAPKNDVIHSFWVPEFRQKQDAVPGLTRTIVVTPERTGTWAVVCTELCGLGHAVMRARVVVMKRAAFEAWASGQKRAVGSGTGAAAGKSVFANNGCGSCHAFRPAASAATIGPDLDKLPTEARKAGRPLEQFVRESIVKPNAYIEPHYPPNVMPHTFGSLPKDELDALVGFLVGKKKA